MTFSVLKGNAETLLELGINLAAARLPFNG